MNKIFIDNRGEHQKFFVESESKALGFRGIKEVFSTINHKGTIRAFHYQGKVQQKIIKALSGKFHVRVIDLNEKIIHEYDYFSKYSDPILVKEGQLLGYLALADNSIMLYMGDEYFDPDTNYGYHPNSFSVNWKNDKLKITMSQKDADAELIEDTFKIITH